MSTINEAIQLAELLLQKYKHEIDPPTHLQCAVKLKHIKDKYADKRLYVSVIGEFSTGKSTFINALLRENLLDSNVVQGTTTVNSIIEHGDALNMLVYPHGSSEVKDLTAIGYSNEIIREHIKSVHRGESAKSIKKVVVKHHSDFLIKGVVVIDTPGTNTPEVWHEKVTKEALDLSDASII